MNQKVSAMYFLKLMHLITCGTFNSHVIFIGGANKYKLSAVDGKIIHLSYRKHWVDMTTGEADITLLFLCHSLGHGHCHIYKSCIYYKITQ